MFQAEPAPVTAIVPVAPGLLPRKPPAAPVPDLAELVDTLLIVRRTLREQIGIGHGRLLAIVRHDDVRRGSAGKQLGTN